MRRSVSIGMLASAFALGAAAPHAAQAQPFTQCPAINDDTSCGALITINPGGALTIALDPMQGPYDGSDDALIGVINNSGMTVNSMLLTTPGLNAFGFDGDGLCAYNIVCTWAHPTGYEGPNMSFSNVASDAASGTIVFTNGLANGASTYFSLEDTPAQIVGSHPGGGVTTTPEPATVGLVAVGLGLAGVLRRRARA
ncbi:MAG TPA: PEP-CTERM sorting domain-containing protein [Gemmatirosa sp.]